MAWSVSCDDDLTCLTYLRTMPKFYSYMQDTNFFSFYEESNKKAMASRSSKVMWSTLYDNELTLHIPGCCIQLIPYADRFAIELKNCPSCWDLMFFPFLSCQLCVCWSFTDKDSNETIDHEELKQCLSDLQVHVCVKEIDVIYHYCDINGKQGIQFNEFIVLLGLIYLLMEPASANQNVSVTPYFIYTDWRSDKYRTFLIYRDLFFFFFLSRFRGLDLWSLRPRLIQLSKHFHFWTKMVMAS